MFNMATSTTGNSFYNQVPLVVLPSISSATGGYGAIYTSATQFNPPQVARGGIFCVVMRTVGATPGYDANVVVELTRIRNSPYSQDATQIGTYGQDNDIF